MQTANKIVSNYVGTSFDHTDVTNGQRYYYAITEVNAAGEGPASLIVSAVPYQVLPAAPFGLKVTALDSAADLVLLVPTPVTTTNVSYNVYRSTSRTAVTAAGKIASDIKFSSSIIYHDLNLTNGTMYYYTITTVVAGKESEFSPIASARPQATTVAVDSSATTLAKFASIPKISAEAGAGTCTVTWGDVVPLVIFTTDTITSTAPYYILYWSDSPDVDSQGVLKNIRGEVDDVAKALTKDTVTGLFTYKLSGLTNGSLYYVQVTAAVKGVSGSPFPGRFTPGPVVAATPGLKTPAAPAAVSATQGAQQVSLSWSKDVSGLSGITYNIYVSTTDAGSPAELMAKGIKKNNDDSTKAYFVHSGLQSGQTYYYVVTAVGEGESAPSSIVSVTL
jgi:fibronectin type 3 domain-containing protein